MTKVEICFNVSKRDKPYVYDMVYPLNPTKQNIASAISTAMVKDVNDKLVNKKKKTRYGYDRYYNLILTLLDNHTNIHYPDGDKPSTKNISFRDMILKNKDEMPKTLSDGTIYLQTWHCGITFHDRLVIDIDNKDIGNLKDVMIFYIDVLKCKFTAIKTGNGFWLISDKTYLDIGEWMYDNCRILNPSLKPDELKVYRNNLLKLDMKYGKFVPASPDEVKASSLYSGFGDICVLYTLLSIKRMKSTLRITKKTKTETIKEVILI